MRLFTLGVLLCLAVPAAARADGCAIEESVYGDPDGAAARGAGYLHGWITAGLLTGVSGGR